MAENTRVALKRQLTLMARQLVEYIEGNEGDSTVNLRDIEVMMLRFAEFGFDEKLMASMRTALVTGRELPDSVISQRELADISFEHEAAVLSEKPSLWRSLRNALTNKGA